MAHHLEMHVIEVKRVRGRTVYQGSIQHRIFMSVTDDARLFLASKGAGDLDKNPGERLVRAAQRHAEPIEQAQLRLRDGVGR